MTLTAEAVSLSDFTSRLCAKPILASTAMYGPWTAEGQFDFEGYRGLVADVLESDSIPATNVDTTWAQYTTWELCREIVLETGRVATGFADRFPPERPLVVVGLNTNGEDIAIDDVAGSMRRKIEDLSALLRAEGVERVRYMIVPDKRLLGAERSAKVGVYREIGRAVADHTGHGMVLFELDIGIPGFGSDFDLGDIVEILSGVPEIHEYKSAVITAKPGQWLYDYDYRDDVARIAAVEAVAPERVQFSTGNDWCIALARLGANLPRFGYLLGASQMSPRLFKLWRQMVENDDLGAIALEQDLQAAARDFWTAGNVGIYRHYIGILLALTGCISSAAPHPACDARFRVRPEDYWRPLKHAVRMGLVARGDAAARARHTIPGAAELSAAELASKVELLG